MLTRRSKIDMLRGQLVPAQIDDAYPERRDEIQAARCDFFSFCRLRNPKFYKPERKYLVELCGAFQGFFESDDLVLIINLPPRHGKSYTAQLFSQWVFGEDRTQKIMTGSYNETLSKTFARSVRNGISERKGDKDVLVYSDIFPGTRIQRGQASASMWSLEDSSTASYLATSPGGTATGFGASLIIIDDLIKNAEEAFNEPLLDKQWSWFTDTMLSRLEEGGKIIIIMTRWASGDLAGRSIKHFAGLGVPCRQVVMRAVQDDGSMLCEDVLSRESYDVKTASMSAEIASANYQQIPVDLKGCLYSNFATYTKLPDQFAGIYAYADTADEGSDYLCSIVWGIYQREAYILDVLYTKDNMELTEPAVARQLDANHADLARIESNNGGKGFARSVQRHLQEDLGNYRTTIKWYHNKKNKQARILSNATWIMQHVRYPEDWRYKWPEYFDAMTRYQKEGRNKHDDAPDATTGVVETMQALGVI